MLPTPTLIGCFNLTDKITINEVVVVEGKDDTANLKRFYAVDTYETRGSALTDDDLDRIERLEKLRGVIVFTDPDYQGERIRKRIMAAVPRVKHAFLTPKEARPRSKTKGRSLGVEHADFRDLEEALNGVRLSCHSDTDLSSDIKTADLIEWGLLLAADSRQRREYLGENLRIGYCNGKQLLKRLNLFAVSLTDLETVMQKYERKRHENSR